MLPKPLQQKVPPTNPSTQKIFERLSSEKNKIDFSNILTENLETDENLFNYDYFHNGAGFDDTFTVDLICNSVVWSEFDTGLTCVQGEDGIFFRPTYETPPYDLNDDSTFSFTLFEDGGTCYATATDRFTMTKVE